MKSDLIMFLPRSLSWRGVVIIKVNVCVFLGLSACVRPHCYITCYKQYEPDSLIRSKKFGWDNQKFG